MAKKKISELPAGGALNGTELVPIVQTGTTKRITAQDIANLGNASGVEGSGTINRLAKFTATSTIGNSQLFDDGTSVGLGTITPLGLLHLFKASAATRMVIDGNAGQNKIITYRTNAVQRFGLYVNNTAESGSNVGSDFAIRAYNDAGTLLSTPLFIKRSTGAATFASSVTAQGANIGINALGTDRMFQISGNTFTSGATQFAAVINPTMGAVTNLYGIYAGLTCTSATNYYALYLETATGTITNKWGIYQSGSGEKNYFAGNVLIGTTTDAGFKLNVLGNSRFSGNGYGENGISSFGSNAGNGVYAVAGGSAGSGVYGYTTDVSSFGGTFENTAGGFGLRVLGKASVSGAATFASSVTAGDSLLINNTSVSKKGYKFQSPSSNWSPQESGIYFTPADGVNAATTFSVELWDGNGGYTNALSIAPLGAATFSSSVKSKNIQIAGASGGYTTGDNPMIGLGSAPVTNTFGTIEAPFGDKMVFNQYHGYKFKVSNNGASPVDALVINIDRTATFSNSIAIGNPVTAAVAVASTHKVEIVIGGTTYYLLATT